MTAHVESVSLADVLLLARVEMGTSVEEAAELVGVTSGVIEAIERGVALPTLDVLVSLVGVLAIGVPWERLFELWRGAGGVD